MQRGKLIAINFAMLFLALQSSCGFGFAGDQPKEIARVNIEGDVYLYVYKSSSSATTEESLQLRVNANSLNADRLFLGYDTLIDYQVVDSNLVLVMLNYQSRNKSPDTMTIRLNELYQASSSAQ